MPELSEKVRELYQMTDTKNIGQAGTTPVKRINEYN
jgi:hypothetical protein